MGLNRFYTYNGQILKTADGNPIGYEKILPPTDYVYFWNFEDSNFTDSVNSLTLTPQSGIPETYGATYKKIGNSGAYIQAGSGDRFDTTDSAFREYINARDIYSLAFWVKVIGVTGSFGTSFFASGNHNSYVQDYIGVTSSGNLIVSRPNAYSSSKTISVSTFTHTDWNLITMIYNGSKLKGFVNAELYAEFSSTANSDPRIPGFGSSDQNSASRPDTGSFYIDGIRLYNYELTSENMLAMYDNEK